MANYETFYDKAAPIKGYGDNFVGYRLPASAIGIPTDPRTSNQIKAVSDKINTGTKVIEVSGIDMGALDYIPKQHLKEINRLKKLAGAELTFHGPLVEPTGVGQNGWDEELRKQVERQVVSAVERGHAMEPDGNIVITFHTSNGLPEPNTKVKVKDENGKEKEISSRFAVINERTGQIANLSGLRDNYFQKEPANVQKQLDEYNKETWSDSLNQITIQAERARIAMLRGITIDEDEGGKKILPELDKKVSALYKISENQKEFDRFMKTIDNDREKELVLQGVNELGFAKRYAEGAYLGLKEVYNQAYDIAKKQKDDKLRTSLEEIRDDIVPQLDKYKKDPDKLKNFVDEIAKASRVLNTLTEKTGAPKVYRPLEEFAVDKASDTFANAAFESYKKFGPTTPVISLENPPAGSGINRAEDIRKLVKVTRDKFVEKAVGDGMDESEAKEQAEKLIGVTWDVGHINMIRKYGYSDKDLKEQTKIIAPFVKHVHLSDNFGLEHTELPMGMGNVPIKEHEEILRKQFGDKLKQIKQIVETGGWYKDFKTTPLRETFEAFGSPLYPMQMAGYWSQPRTGGYFAGYGKTLPDVHFQTYGAGFSNLPIDLGGEMQGRSRVSGTPLE